MESNQTKYLNNIDEQYRELEKLINSTSIDNQIKIKMIDQLQNTIINCKNSGKKIIKKICGQKIKLPKKYMGKYIQTCKWKQNLSHEYNSNCNFRKIGNNKSDSFFNIERENNQNYRKKLLSYEPVIKTNPYLREQYMKVQNILNKNTISIIDQNNLMRNFINDNVCILNYQRAQVNNDPNLYPDHIAHHTENNELSDNNDLENNCKPSMHKNNFFQKFLTKVSAVVTALFMLVSASAISKTAHQNPQPDNTRSTSATQMSNNTNKIVKPVTRNIKASINNVNNINAKQRKKVTPKRNIKRINKIKVNRKKYINFNTKFTVKKGSLIYGTVANSINNSNGYTTYYSHDSLRTCAGLGIQYNDSTVSFVSLPNNPSTYEIRGLGSNMYLAQEEANKLVDKLVCQGGKIVSVVSRNTNSKSTDIEGTFSIQNVKVYQKS